MENSIKHLPLKNLLSKCLFSKYLFYRDPENLYHIDFFLNPLPILSLVLMALNDHWFKYAFPSWWTGKLSDFTGMFYFPLQLAALVILLKNSGTWLYQTATKKTTSMDQAPPRKWVLSRPLLLVCIFIAALCLLSVKLSQQANQWITEFFQSYLFSIRMMMDPTDLWALVMLPLAYLYGVLFIPPQRLS